MRAASAAIKTSGAAIRPASRAVGAPREPDGGESAWPARSRGDAQRWCAHVRRYLINGLLIWVPVLVTVLVVRFILQLMDQTLLVLPDTPSVRTRLLGLHVPGFGAVLGLLIVLLTGLLVTNFIGQALVAIGEDLLERIPFVRALYSGVKSFSETVLSNSGNSFKKVLLVEYPRAGIAWSIGFQTTDHLPEINARLGEAAGLRVHAHYPQPDLGLHRLRAARRLHRARHACGRGDEDDRDPGRSRPPSEPDPAHTGGPHCTAGHSRRPTA